MKGMLYNFCMRVKKLLVVAFAFLFFAVCASAQSSESVSKMLETPAISVGQAAYFMAAYTTDDSSFSEAEALEFCVSTGLCKEISDADRTITLSEFAGLCMRTFDLKGGLLYTLTKSDHYAFRELQAKGVIARLADPSATLSGSNALMIITECLAALEG